MEPERFHYDLENCSIKRALDVLGEKWTLLVLREAIYGVRRFDDFARALKCGRGVLSARLKTLIDAGILKRGIQGRRTARPCRISSRREGHRSVHDHICAVAVGGSLDAPAWRSGGKGNRSGVGPRGEGCPDQRAEAEIVVDARPQDRAGTWRETDQVRGHNQFAISRRRRGMGGPAGLLSTRASASTGPSVFAGDKPAGA